MDGKFNINSNKINTKNEIDKNNQLKIFYNNITNSSKKPNSKISILKSKLNINKKEKRKNIKNEMTLNITTKKHSKKKQIITEKKEKIPKSSKQEQDKKEEKDSKSLLISPPDVSKIVYFNQKKMKKKIKPIRNYMMT